MLPDRTKILWKLIDAHEKSMIYLREIETSVEKTPANKAHFDAERELMRRMLYFAIYGLEPPVDLPDNWERDS
jgi:hypothetical protein